MPTKKDEVERRKPTLNEARMMRGFPPRPQFDEEAAEPVVDAQSVADTKRKIREKRDEVQRELTWIEAAPPEKLVWQTGDNRRLRVRAMQDRHIFNTLAFLERRRAAWEESYDFWNGLFQDSYHWDDQHPNAHAAFVAAGINDYIQWSRRWSEIFRRELVRRGLTPPKTFRKVSHPPVSLRTRSYYPRPRAIQVSGNFNWGPDVPHWDGPIGIDRSDADYGVPGFDDDELPF